MVFSRFSLHNTSFPAGILCMRSIHYLYRPLEPTERVKLNPLLVLSVLVALLGNDAWNRHLTTIFCLRTGYLFGPIELHFDQRIERFP